MRKTSEKFISEAVSIHSDKYDYSKVDYITSKIKVCIICPEHGEFWQTPDGHLRGNECPTCGHIKKGERFKITKNRNKDWNFTQPETHKLIPLTKGKFAKVDNEDFERMKGVNWNITEQGYSYNRKLGLMHRFIMNAPEGMDIDHVNHDRLDNRKSNLRLATRSENISNKRPKKGSSQYKGVSWYEPLNKWRVYITFNYKRHHLGLFKNEKEAAEAYDKKALELFGEFAYLNFKDEKE